MMTYDIIAALSRTSRRNSSLGQHDGDPGKKDLLGHIQGAVAHATQSELVVEERALRAAGVPRCPPEDGKLPQRPIPR